ncbi:MAG: hypothetical protein IKO11_06230, partial [Lachnospiraceae bacterium]|nr:hypothetical protein [Lachnospiraceae bacterium]
MAASGNGRRRQPPAAKKTAGRSSGKQRSAAPSGKKKQEQAESELFQVIVLFVLFCVLLLISLCVYDVIGGVFGPAVKAVTVGLFGGLAYVLPPVVILVLVYLSFFAQNKPARHGVVGFVLFWVFLGVFISFLSVNHPALNGDVELKDTFFGRVGSCADHFYHEGGGVLFGLPSFLLFKLFGNGGGVFVSILLLLFAMLLMAGRGFFDGIRDALSASMEEKRHRREALDD